jgi:hypothetical protein
LYANIYHRRVKMDKRKKMLRKKSLGAVVCLAVLALVFAACPTDSSGNDSKIVTKNVTAANFASTLEDIKDKPGEYLINLSGDVIDYTGIAFATPGVKVTLKGTVTNKITFNRLTATETSLFTVSKGAVLILENIALIGTDEDTTSNNAGLLCVGQPDDENGGTIEIKTGVTITNKAIGGSGISVARGSLTMSGGTITECVNVGVTFRSDCVDGSFTMSGGTISKNSAGVVTNGTRSSFAMSDGAIKENGIGVVLNPITSNACSFNMWGTISDNTANGVVVFGKNCTAAISNGTISGNTNFGLSVGGEGNTVTISGGTISGTINNDGVAIGGKGSIANITDNGQCGVRLAYNTTTNAEGTVESENCKLTISGGTISGSNNAPIVQITGKGAEFEKKNTGGKIAAKGSGAVVLVGSPGSPFLTRNSDVDSSDSLKVKINAAGNTVEDSSGTWN